MGALFQSLIGSLVNCGLPVASSNESKGFQSLIGSLVNCGPGDRNNKNSLPFQSLIGSLVNCGFIGVLGYFSLAKASFNP